jgi:hypothetical protein
MTSCFLEAFGFTGLRMAGRLDPGGIGLTSSGGGVKSRSTDFGISAGGRCIQLWPHLTQRTIRPSLPKLAGSTE